MSKRRKHISYKSSSYMRLLHRQYPLCLTALAFMCPQPLLLLLLLLMPLQCVPLPLPAFLF